MAGGNNGGFWVRLGIELLDIFTLMSMLLMIGVELTVSVFINPAIWKRDDHAMTTELAGSIGRAMPFWYGSCLLLLATEAFLRRHESGATWLMCAAVIWLCAIIYTVTFLVPINNRLAASAHTTPGFDWKRLHKKWDMFHGWRIGVLVVAAFAFLSGLYQAGLHHGW